ncbi:hypothetical protein ACFLTD_02910 [Elusimicrobiota bacterium]
MKQKIHTITEKTLLYFLPKDLDAEEKRKRLISVISKLLIILFFIFFSFNTSDNRQVIINLIVVLSLIITLFLMKNSTHALKVYRSDFGILTLFLLYIVWSGIGQNGSLLWLYLLPLMIFFFLEAREGLCWMICFAAILFPVLLLPAYLSSHKYETALTLRFIFSFTAITIFSYGLERSRKYYFEQLQKEQENLKIQKIKLEEAIKEIRTLSGLLPICASCKKIRDDKGYWTQIESFIKDRSDAKFSHSICPDCMKEMYSETL